MKKIIINVIMLLLCYNAIAQCRTFRVQGPNLSCSGRSANYTINYERYQNISWAVSGSSDPDITSAAGINIQQLRATLGIPASASLTYLFYDRGNAIELRFSTTTTINGVLVGSNRSINVRTNGQVVFNANVIQLINFIFTGGDGAENISVNFKRAGTASISSNATSLGFEGICGSRGGNLNVNVSESLVGTPTIQVNFQTPVNGCNNNTLQFQTVSIPGAFYSWTVQDGNIDPRTLSAINRNFILVNGFRSSGSKLITLRIVDPCGTVVTSTTTIVVTEPTTELRVNQLKMADINNSGTYIVRCNEAQYGFNVSFEPYISSTTSYEVILPPGWIDQGKSPISTSTVQGRIQRTYRGNDQRYFYIKSDNLYDFGPGGDILVNFTTPCGSVQTIRLALQTGSALNVSLADQSSCSANVTLIPTITGGLAPYQLNWWTSSDGVLATSQTSSPNINNSLDGRTFGTKSVTVQVRDASGCLSTDNALINITGGVTSGDPTVSGWLSGHINPQQDAQVYSNLAKASNANRIYYVHNTIGLGKEVYFYEFDNVIGKWVSKPSGVINVIQQSLDNTLQYVRIGSYDLLFYINRLGNLEYAKMDLNTGRIDNNVFVPIFSFNTISPVEYEYGYQVRAIGGSLFQIVWRDLFSRNIQSIEAGIDNLGNLQIDAGSLKVLVDATPGRIRYDMDFKNNRIIYFKDDGGLYYREMQTGSPEIKLNGFSFNDYVSTVTDMRIDADGNLYYVANGDLYTAKFDNQGNFTGLFQIETTDNVLPSGIASGAKGALEINRSTNTIYYAGYNGNMYQIYRKSDYAATGNFGVIRATPLSFYDQVQGSIIYSQPNVFYRSLNNRVYNLFYITNDPACMPQYQRTASTGLEEDRVNPYEESTVYMKPIPTTYEAGLKNKAMAYPVPVQAEVNIVGNGQTIETIKITGIDGSEIYNEAIGLASAVVSTASWSSGVYLVTLQYTSGKTETLKIIK
ncbi:MAG: T9SS type A sorting domain-containing protein [Cytophagaceae bacterium]|jgi:hypothetical protein|nr:T9SS type A sorting domain-containing protein [Cytophagaceae bacterium]